MREAIQRLDQERKEMFHTFGVELEAAFDEFRIRGEIRRQHADAVEAANRRLLARTETKSS